MINRKALNYEAMLVAITLIDAVFKKNPEQQHLAFTALDKEDLIEGLAGLSMIALEAINASKGLQADDTLILSVMRSIILRDLMIQIEAEENKKDSDDASREELE